jgi:glycosyltransferase involved in cell wall biosynthesis
MLRERCAGWVPHEKQIVIPNTIEESILLDQDELAAKRMTRQHRSEFRLLYLGSMTPSKGWADVVRAAEILHQHDIAVKLDLVGRWESDQAEQVFADYVTQHGLSSVIIHHGPVRDRAEIKAFYAQADAFVLPTYYPTEAQPLTIIEALNAGTPLITTRHAGIPEMLDEGVEGFFVSARQPEAIAAAVQRMTDTEAWTRLSIAARKRFEKQFAPDTVRDLWLDLLK